MRAMPTLPSQANTRAGEAMASRRPMPAQAGGGMRPEMPERPMKKGGKVKAYAKGGSVDGCATKGKTKGKMR